MEGRAESKNEEGIRKELKDEIEDSNRKSRGWKTKRGMSHH